MRSDNVVKFACKPVTDDLSPGPSRVNATAFPKHFTSSAYFTHEIAYWTVVLNTEMLKSSIAVDYRDLVAASQKELSYQFLLLSLNTFFKDWIRNFEQRIIRVIVDFVGTIDQL